METSDRGKQNPAYARARAALTLWGTVKGWLASDEVVEGGRKSRIDAQIKALGLEPIYPRRKNAKPLNHREIEAAKARIASGLRCGYSGPVLPLSSNLPPAPDCLRQAYRLPDDPEDAVWVYLVVELLLARMPRPYGVLAAHVYGEGRRIDTTPGTETARARWERHHRLIVRVQFEIETAIEETMLGASLRRVG